MSQTALELPRSFIHRRVILVTIGMALLSAICTFALSIGFFWLVQPVLSLSHAGPNVRYAVLENSIVQVRVLPFTLMAAFWGATRRRLTDASRPVWLDLILCMVVFSFISPIIVVSGISIGIHLATNFNYLLQRYDFLPLTQLPDTIGQTYLQIYITFPATSLVLILQALVATSIGLVGAERIAPRRRLLPDTRQTPVWRDLASIGGMAAGIELILTIVVTFAQYLMFNHFLWQVVFSLLGLLLPGLVFGAIVVSMTLRHQSQFLPAPPLADVLSSKPDQPEESDGVRFTIEKLP